MNASKRKGTAAETAVVGWLQAHGFPYAERRALAGSGDRGDIGGIPGVVLEVKNCRRDELPGWVDEANVEARNADRGCYSVACDPANAEPHAAGIVVHKRVGTTDPGRWFATMDLATLARLIR